LLYSPSDNLLGGGLSIMNCAAIEAASRLRSFEACALICVATVSMAVVSWLSGSRVDASRGFTNIDASRRSVGVKTTLSSKSVFISKLGFAAAGKDLMIFSKFG